MFEREFNLNKEHENYHNPFKNVWDLEVGLQELST